jgi:hypothetical protein
MTEIPDVPAGTKSRDKEVDVDKMGQPAGISRLALSPREIVVPSNETFSCFTGLSAEYIMWYR